MLAAWEELWNAMSHSEKVSVTVNTQLKAQSEPLQMAAVNETARLVVAKLHQSLTDQPSAISILLNQPNMLLQ